MWIFFTNMATAILAKLGWSVVTRGALAVAFFAAIKVLLAGVLFLSLPIILYNVFLTLGVDLASFVLTKLAESTLPEMQSMELTGLGAWVAEKLKIPQVMSIAMTAVSTRWGYDFLRGTIFRGIYG